MKSLKEELGKISISMENAGKSTIDSFAPAMYEAYLNMISEKIITMLKEQNIADKGIPEVTAVTINYLLNNNRCICGKNLKDNPECREELIELLSYLPPESIGSQIKDLNNKLRSFRGQSSNSELFDSRFTTYTTLAGNFDERDSEYHRLVDEVGNKQDADKIKETYLKLEKSLKDERNRQIETDAKLKDCERRLKEAENDLTSISGRLNINYDVNLQIEYANELYKRANIAYEKESKDIIELMRTTLTGVFNDMYHGQRTITLSDNYKVTLSVEGSSLDASKGLETVANFAFISSLLKVARDRVNPDGAGYGLQSEPYPLAMDAVFSNTDEIHIKNICKNLPELAEQSILAIMDKDWNFAKEPLSDKVGSAYRIEKINERLSKLIPLEEGTW